MDHIQQSDKKHGWLYSFTRSESQSAILKKRIEEGTVRDRRHSERDGKNLKIGFSVLGPDTSVPIMEGYGHTLDTSPKGLRMATPNFIDTPKMLQIDLQLPEPPYHSIILSEAVRCQEDEETGLFHVAVKFLGNLEPNLQEQLQ